MTDDDIEMFLDDIYDSNIDGRPEVVRLYVSKWIAEERERCAAIASHAGLPEIAVAIRNNR